MYSGHSTSVSYAGKGYHVSVILDNLYLSVPSTSLGSRGSALSETALLIIITAFCSWSTYEHQVLLGEKVVRI
jgi:hypothetical protein